MATAAPGPRLHRSRRPERTLLNWALADQFEHLLGVYEERFEPTHGCLRRSLAPAVYRYLECGIFAHGAARAHCAECGHDALRPTRSIHCSAPYCGASMRIIAFLVDFASLRRLLAHLGFAPQQPEPLAHSPSDEPETFAAHA